MKFSQSPLSGAWLISPEMRSDSRGSFARLFCVEEMAAHGLDTHIAQVNLSVNVNRGIVRGLHYQRDPHAETKLVRCERGRIHDVIVDLRTNSPSYRQWHAVELSAENGHQLYVPQGFAHGFQVLEDDTRISYCMGAAYVAEAQAGLRWNDPTLAIGWPLPDLAILSERDREWPLIKDIDQASDAQRRSPVSAPRS